jgi:hypothetical protein
VAYARPIAAPLERCAEFLGVDLATIQRAAAYVEPSSESMARRSGASCSWNGGSDRSRTGEFEAATSPDDGGLPQTPVGSAWRPEAKRTPILHPLCAKAASRNKRR